MTELEKKIKDKNVDIDYYALEIIRDSDLRDTVLGYLMDSKDIGVYYHSYYILDKASKLEPNKFYGYFQDYCSLLNNKNSYHRSIGLTLLANIVCVDIDNNIDSVFQRCLELINDNKFMTAEVAVRQISRIVEVKPNLGYIAMDYIVEHFENLRHKEKQIELLKSDIIELYSIIYSEAHPEKNTITSFVKGCKTSSSPKTRKRAQLFLKTNKK